uniref:Uncharacterized protein n=1 Tax=Romanomermis culicivorax TaxID=13658 RepID=A0A915LAJ1_ROMCU
MILKDGKAAKGESDKEEERKQKVDVGIGKRPIVEKTALSALQLSRKLIKAKSKFSSSRKRNGLVSKSKTILPSKKSPRNVSAIGHCRKIEISKPTVVRAESSQKLASEISTSKSKNESSKDIKRKTLLSVLARMSNGGGPSLKPILHRLPEKAVDKNDDDDEAKNKGNRELELRNNGNTATNFANKSVMIEKFVERITTALSSSLTEICDEIYRNAASVPRETNEQPCCSNDPPLITEKLASRENEDKFWFYKDAISSISRNTGMESL